MSVANETMESGGPASEAGSQRNRARRERVERFVEALQHSGHTLRERFERSPTLGFALAGGFALVAATTIGVGEVLAASVLGYAAYRKLGGAPLRPASQQHHGAFGSEGAPHAPHAPRAP